MSEDEPITNETFLSDPEQRGNIVNLCEILASYI